MKICVMGFSGSGKSTLARQLGEHYNISVLHLDSVQFKANWEERSKEEFNEIVENFLKSESQWIIDGNYTSKNKERFEEADIIYYLNYNRFFCLNSIIKRYKSYKSQTRPDMTEGCEEKIDKEFILWVLFKGRTRHKKKAFFKIVKNAPKYYIFKNRKSLQKHLRELGLENI